MYLDGGSVQHCLPVDATRAPAAYRAACLAHPWARFYVTHENWLQLVVVSSLSGEGGESASKGKQGRGAVESGAKYGVQNGQERSWTSCLESSKPSASNLQQRRQTAM